VRRFLSNYFDLLSLLRYSDGDPLTGGFECRWGRLKSRFSTVSRSTQSWSFVNRMTARFDVTPKTTEQNRIVRTAGESEAKVTNNKNMRSMYYRAYC